MYSESFMSKTKTADFLCRYLKCVLLALLLLPMKAGAVEAVDFDLECVYDDLTPFSAGLRWTAWEDYDDEFDCMEIEYSTVSDFSNIVEQITKRIDDVDTDEDGNPYYYYYLNHLKPGTTYYIRIRAQYKDKSYSDWDNKYSVTTMSIPKPIFSVDEEKCSAEKIVVSFYGYDDEEFWLNYNQIECVYSEDSTANPDALFNVGTNVVTVTGSLTNDVELSGLESSTTYYIWCRINYGDDSGTSGWSDRVSGTTLSPEKPSVSVNYSESGNSLTSIQIAWTFDNPTDQSVVSSIDYVYSTDGNDNLDNLTVNTASPSAGSATLSGLQIGTTYYIWCRANYGDLGHEDWTRVEATTENVTIEGHDYDSDGYATQLVVEYAVNYDDNHGSNANYIEYVYSKNGNANPDDLAISTTSITSSGTHQITLSDLQVATDYYIWFRAVVGSGDDNDIKSGWSSRYQISTYVGTPTLNYIDERSCYATEIEASCNLDEQDAEAVLFFYSTDKDATPNVAGATRVTDNTNGEYEITLENLQINTKYYVWCCAYYGESGGYSPWTEKKEASTTKINLSLYENNAPELEPIADKTTFYVSFYATNVGIEDYDKLYPKSWELAYSTDPSQNPDDIDPETIIKVPNDSVVYNSLQSVILKNVSNPGIKKYYFYVRGNYGETGGVTSWSKAQEKDMGFKLHFGWTGFPSNKMVQFNFSYNSDTEPDSVEVRYTTSASMSPDDIVNRKVVNFAECNGTIFVEFEHLVTYYVYMRGYSKERGEYDSWTNAFTVVPQLSSLRFPTPHDVTFTTAKLQFAFEKESDLAKYKFSYTTDPDVDKETLIEYDITSNDVELTGLTPRTRYYYYVRYHDEEVSEWYRDYYSYCFETNPKPDIDIVINTENSTYVDVTWTASAMKETHWQFVCVEQGQPMESGETLEIDNTLSYRLTGLTPSTRYDVYLRGYIGGDIEYTDWVKASFKTSATTLPTCRVWTPQFHSASLRFTIPSGDWSDYQFVYTTDQNADKSTLMPYDLSSGQIISGLTPWATYYVYIRKKDGSLDWFQAASFVAEERIGPYAELAKGYSATLRWKITDLSEDEWELKVIDFDTKGESYNQSFTVTTTPSQILTGLTPLTRYQVQIRLKKGDRYGTWWTADIYTTEHYVDGPVYIDGEEETEPYLILGDETCTTVAYRARRDYTGAYRIPATFVADNVTYQVVEVRALPQYATSLDFSRNTYLTKLSNSNNTYGNLNLKSLNLSGCTALETIDESAFYRTGIEGSLDLSSCTSLTNIEKFAFNDCNSITSINLPGSLTSIGANAFSGSSITYVNFENGTEPLSIGYFGFAHMPNLKRVNLPNNLENIGGHFLCGCAALKSLVIPASVKNIEGAFLHGCQSLENVYLLGEPGILKSADVITGLYSFGPVDTCKHVNNCTFWVNGQEAYNAYIGQETDGEHVWARLDETNVYNTKGSDNPDWTDKRYYIDHTGDFTEANGGYKNKYSWEIQSSRSVQALKWSTICFPFGGETTYKNYLKTTAFMDGETNYVNDVIIAELIDAEPDVTTGSYNLTFKQVSIDNLQSNKPYLIYMPRATKLDMLRGGSMTAAHWTCDISTTVVADAENNVSVRMRGSYIDNKYLPKDLFYLVSSTDNDGDASMLFKKTATWGGTYVPPYRCYFEILKDGAVMNNARLGGLTGDSETTGIENIQQTTGNERRAANGIYTISGMRLNVESLKDLPRGIYIVDGEKVVVK